MPTEFESNKDAIRGEYQDDIKKKAFWFTRAKLRVTHWPFAQNNMVEDLSRVIPAGVYGGVYESAQLSTRSNFERTFSNPVLLDALAHPTETHEPGKFSVNSQERKAYALISHGYNSDLLLGKSRNSEVKQAAYNSQIYSAGTNESGQTVGAWSDAWAKLTNDEPQITPNQFIDILRAERKLAYPEFIRSDLDATVEPNLRYGVPHLERNIRLTSLIPSLDGLHNEGFATLMNNISNKFGIDLVASDNVDPWDIKMEPKRFFGRLNTIKKRLSPYKNGINPTGWPKRYTLQYSNYASMTNTDKAYGVIKYLSQLQAEQLLNVAERVLSANPMATNLPSSELFNENRERLAKSAACLISSELCYMLGMSDHEANLFSMTYKLEARQNLELMTDDAKENGNLMTILADIHAIGINNLAHYLKPDLKAYAKCKGVNYELVGERMGGEPSLQGIMYANNVHISKQYEIRQDMNSDDIVEALNRVMDRGRVLDEMARISAEEEQSKEQDRTITPRDNSSLGNMGESAGAGGSERPDDTVEEDIFIAEADDEGIYQPQKPEETPAPTSETPQEEPIIENPETPVDESEAGGKYDRETMQRIFGRMTNNPTSTKKKTGEQTGIVERELGFIPSVEAVTGLVQENEQDNNESKISETYEAQEQPQVEETAQPKVETPTDSVKPEAQDILGYYTSGKYNDKETADSLEQENEEVIDETMKTYRMIQEQKREELWQEIENRHPVETPVISEPETPVVSETQKAVKQKPILKSIEFSAGELTPARGAEVLQYTAKKTVATNCCREIICELVKEYSSEQLGYVENLEAEIKKSKDKTSKPYLTNALAFSVDHTKVGSTVRTLLEEKMEKKTKGPSYSANSFPEEYNAMREIDQYTGYIMSKVKEFVDINDIKDKKITKGNVNKLLETIGEKELEERIQSGQIVTRNEKLDAGKALIKEVLRTGVYDILDSVHLDTQIEKTHTIPQENKEVLEDKKALEEKKEKNLVQSNLDNYSNGNAKKDNAYEDALTR